MYSIISPNVIRQSLSVMGAPRPIRMENQSSIITSQDGTLLQQVDVIFSRDELFTYTYKTGVQNYTHPDTIKNALQQCFCADVTIDKVSFVSGKRQMKARLLTTVTAKGE